MRRALLVMALGLAAMAPAPARATHSYDHPQKHTFRAPTPCSLLCPYWALGAEAACDPEPLALDDSWDEWRIDVEPPATDRAVVFAVFAIAPLIDYDLFVCRTEPAPDGTRLLADGRDRWELCDWAPPILLCYQIVQIPICMTVRHPAAPPAGEECVAVGTPIAMRVFNGHDPEPALVGDYFYSKTGFL